MATRKKPVTTPLHLLQQLSHSLLEHLEQACSQALVEAEQLLAKLEKQRSKVQDKLHKAVVRLEEAAAAGKARAQTKARERIGELEELLDTLKQRQAQTREYILHLKQDAEQSLHLAQGIGKVKAAVGELLQQREAGDAAAPAKPRTPRRPRAAAALPATPAPVAPASRSRRAGKPAAAATASAAPATTPVAEAPAKPTRKRSPAGSRPAPAKAPAGKPATGRGKAPAGKAPAGEEPGAQD